jgi:hypothetical protein
MRNVRHTLRTAALAVPIQGEAQARTTPDALRFSGLLAVQNQLGAAFAPAAPNESQHQKPVKFSSNFTNSPSIALNTLSYAATAPS